MENGLIGRKVEQEILHEALASSEAELISVIGRRRIGKTYLINTVYERQIVFEIAGIQKASLKRQLRNFVAQLTQFIGPRLQMPIQEPTDWFDAFLLLIKYLEPLMGDEKKVVFLDELPWLATRRSDFLQAFGYFWNSWASRKNIVVVICGSAASWMIRKVVHHKGGLHNRITRRINLKPFTLAETEEYLKSQNVFWDRYQILHVYMAMGGVPHYLKEIQASNSAIQNIDRICFSDAGLLKDEFSQLYPALFDRAEHHMAVVRALAKKRKGMARTEIIDKANLPSGGGASKVLDELEKSGFISAYYPFGKKKRGKLFRLTDEYSLFYLQFMEDKKMEGTGTWQHLSQTRAYQSWSGFTFESICLKHIPQIKKALSIGGIYSLASSFFHKGTNSEKGAQIDLVLDRNDHVINLFEVKFSNDSFSLSKSYADTLKQKMRVFRQATQTRKQLSWVMITTFGLSPNTYSVGLIDADLTMDALFEEL